MTRYETRKAIHVTQKRHRNDTETTQKRHRNDTVTTWIRTPSSSTSAVFRTSRRQCRLEINPYSLLFVSGFFTRTLQSSLTPKTIVASVTFDDSGWFRPSLEFSNFSSCSATNGIRDMGLACWFGVDSNFRDIGTSRGSEPGTNE